MSRKDEIFKQLAKDRGFDDAKIEAYMSTRATPQVESMGTLVEPVQEIAPITPPTAPQPQVTSRKDEIFKELAKERGFDDAKIQEYNRVVEENPVPLQTTPQPLPNIEPVPITQTFGQRSRYDVFSGGVNTGVDYATPPNTPLMLPHGDWVVEESFSQARPDGGFIGNGINQGYGNSVLVRNKQTGEALRLSHLADVYVNQGDELQGGLIGTTGASGNVTGSHLDAEYIDADGRLADILQSPYANIVPFTR